MSKLHLMVVESDGVVSIIGSRTTPHVNLEKDLRFAKGCASSYSSAVRVHLLVSVASYPGRIKFASGGDIPVKRGCPICEKSVDTVLSPHGVVKCVICGFRFRDKILVLGPDNPRRKRIGPIMREHPLKGERSHAR